ncbi:MAG: cytochrome c oxidase assembly protein [Alphaproteobacteria bacterium]|nr:cytochrome c oxidase assembly protein [Alphaproteobacteria bacterium]
MDNPLARKNARTGLIVLAVVVGMGGVSFAAVPMYRVFCQMTGFGGTPLVSATLPGTVLARTIQVRFNADVGQNLSWDFAPEQRQITVRLGQRGLTAYRAHNPENKAVTGVAVYNVTPPKAGKYFHKIECFCFGEQTLQPKQTVSMPVMFYVDPALDKDPNMRDVTSITLSYTFYQAGTKALDEAMDAFYNEAN